MSNEFTSGGSKIRVRYPVLSSVLPIAFDARSLRIFTWIWILCVVAGSLMPGNAKDFVGTTDTVRIHAPRHDVEGVTHRMWHVGVFGFTAILLIFQANGIVRQAGAALGAFGLGLILEIVQPLIYGNVFEWWDVRDDAMGAGAAFLLFRVVWGRRG